ncbi:MAG: hypothetical protein AVDCRST_MAG30-3655, partial [uncultured Solirubrobacteraceae bacterium]
ALLDARPVLRRLDRLPGDPGPDGGLAARGHARPAGRAARRGDHGDRRGHAPPGRRL